MMNRLGFSFVAAVLALTAGSAAAEEQKSERQYVIDLGAGLMAQPRYPGSDETILVPYPLIAVGRFYVPGIGDAGGSDSTRRLSVYPSFNFIGKREASDSDELEGMEDVDWSLEVGLGVAYRYNWLRGFVELRQGFNGYSGQVADFGLDVIATPTEDLTLTLGPRAGWGSDDYMKTYFGISAAEAAESPIYDKSYDAGAGFNTAGLAATANYKLTDTVTLRMLGGWNRLIGDAGDSPIVEEGSENQFYGGAGLTYRFEFDVFD
ncbi:MAG: MipA/OmpV family protein [Aestuariivirga sp.]|uniref:MipA/OmpV family protein n=1 Tax=Aestuariivirga sp. TaxID=2650926 RepID=UPI0038D2036E